MATGQLRQTITGNTGDLRDIAFVDNDRPFSADDLGNLHVLHVPLGELPCATQPAHNPTLQLAVPPDGQNLALRPGNRQVGLLDISPEKVPAYGPDR